jgi:hypothetical protein
MDKPVMSVSGIVRYIPLEGGFFGIIGDDGQRYDPLESLPEGFRVDGKRVSFNARQRDGYTTHMWGTAITIISIE